MNTISGTDWTVYNGDCRAALPLIAPGSVQCVVTSPPYFGLRDYGVDGQMGLEPTPEEFVEALVQVFRQVRDVLRDDGTVWLNLGDSYTSGGRENYGTFSPDSKQATQPAIKSSPRPRQPDGLKSKDLIGIPWRVAFALQEDGWYLRQDIIWHKPNPMPESVRDRCTKAHEYIFLLTQSPRYYYDAEAIREEPSGVSGGLCFGGSSKGKCMREDGMRLRGRDMTTEDRDRYMTQGANKRSVWTIPTHPYPDAHFATFPPALVAPCILAGTSEQGCCPECGKPWERIVEKSRSFQSGSGRSGRDPVGKNGESLQGGGETRDVRRGPCVRSITTGWQPSCECNAGEPVPCTILDPFAGSGTTASVALGLGRQFVGCELNPEYLPLIEQRASQPWRPGADGKREKPNPRWRTLFDD